LAEVRPSRSSTVFTPDFSHAGSGTHR
jgi:hypothetical protein